MDYTKIKTKNNNQCVGPCYKKNTTITHPIYGELVKETVPFCPTSVWTDKWNYKHLTDKCFSPQSDINVFKQTTSFTASLFLTIYDIHNIDNLYTWIENNMNQKEYKTVERVISCGLNFYKDNVDKISFSLVEFVKKYTNNKLSDEKIYQILKKNINAPIEISIDKIIKKYK